MFNPFLPVPCILSKILPELSFVAPCSPNCPKSDDLQGQSPTHSAQDMKYRQGNFLSNDILTFIFPKKKRCLVFNDNNEAKKIVAAQHGGVRLDLYQYKCLNLRSF